MNKITVKELKELLNKYKDDAVVQLLDNEGFVRNLDDINEHEEENRIVLIAD
jgi:hypothetical protein